MDVVSIRDFARRCIPRVLHSFVLSPWVLARPQPAEPNPINFVLYAVVGAWMEADIIEATVLNAFVQGVDRVFLVDNDSPDDTVQRAQKAGAEHVLTYKTTTYDEEYRINIMIEFVR